MNNDDSILHAIAGRGGALQFAADLAGRSSASYDTGDGRGPVYAAGQSTKYADIQSHSLCKFGVDRIDRALHGGLPIGALHEIRSAGPGDYPAAAAFCLLMGERCAAFEKSVVNMARGESILWISAAGNGRNQKLLYAPGLIELGVNPDNIIHAQAGDSLSALRVAADAVKSGAVAAVILNISGRKAAGLDMTATRRFSLFARESGSAMFMLRDAADDAPNAAYSRWSAASSPSCALGANAPGGPVFAIELLRHRRGIEGLTARLEWKREARIFTEYTPDIGAASAVVANRKDFARTQPQEYAGAKRHG